MLNSLLQLTTMFLKLWALPLVQAWLEVYDSIAAKFPTSLPQGLQLAINLSEAS